MHLCEKQLKILKTDKEKLADENHKISRKK